MTVIYLDNNASTQVDPAVVKAMDPWTRGDMYGNPHSGHFLGALSRDAMEMAREQVKAVFGVEGDSGWKCIFTSGASESNNLAIKGFVFRYMRGSRAETERGAPIRIISSAVEHGSVDKCIDWCVDLFGKEAVVSHRLLVDKHGVVDINQPKIGDVKPGSIDLVTCIHTVAETGAVQPINTLASLLKAHSPQCLFHCDASQSVGKLDTTELHSLTEHVDMITVAGHKFNGPKGVGALLIRETAVSRLDPLIHGAGQEFGLRGGTEDVASIVGLGAACEAATNRVISPAAANRLWELLSTEFDKSGIVDFRLNSTAPVRAACTINFSVAGLDGPTTVCALGNGVKLPGVKICFSAGSACHSRGGCSTPSKVLDAMGLDNRYSTAGLRLSVGHSTSTTDVETAAPAIAKYIIDSLSVKQ